MSTHNIEMGSVNEDPTSVSVDDTFMTETDLHFATSDQERLGSDGESKTQEEEESYATREQEILSRIHGYTSYLKSRLMEAAQVGSAALVMGLSNSAFAETPVSSLPLTIETTQAKEALPLPTYREAKARLHSSILTAPTEEVGYFVRTKPDEAMRTIILKKGESVSVGTSREEFERIKTLIKSRQADVEIVHTHPLSAVEQVGYITPEESAKVRSGERPRFSFAPSATDWMMLVSDDDIYGYPPGQWSNRVIDTAGEWEYGISDSNAPFIRSLRNLSKETDDVEKFGLNKDEKQYIEKLNDEYKESFFVIQELNKRQGSDPLANAIITKINQHMDRSVKKSAVSDLHATKFAELCGAFDPNISITERDRKIARMQELATDLGFYIRYTPNVPVAEVREKHAQE